MTSTSISSSCTACGSARSGGPFSIRRSGLNLLTEHCTWNEVNILTAKGVTCATAQEQQ